jgi:hypothetical protein
MPAPLLDREEYIEQAYFFRVFRERLEENRPAQEILEAVREEVLATTKLPMAIDYLRGEILHKGKMGEGMARLPHYFTPFQAFVMENAEVEKSRFDQKTALKVLEREAEYLAGSPTRPGLFIYQFECVARNRLGYDRGMKAIAEDPFYDAPWRDWILKIRLRLGATDFADLLYYRSEHYVQERRRRGQPDYQPTSPVFFSGQEGRIARANRGKDPLYMFAALQRQLGYPAVPRIKPVDTGPAVHPALEARLQRLDKRIQLLEMEAKGKFDLSEFYVNPPKFTDDGAEPAGN